MFFIGQNYKNYKKKTATPPKKNPPFAYNEP